MKYYILYESYDMVGLVTWYVQSTRVLTRCIRFVYGKLPGTSCGLILVGNN